MTSILCKNGSLWDGEKFYCADVLVKEGLMCKIDPNINEVVDFVYDATGRFTCTYEGDFPQAIWDTG